MSSTESNVIELSALKKCYGPDIVVDDIDLQVRTGECFVLVGQNGAGKTTLMKLMLGLTRPSSGQVRVLGNNPASRSSIVDRQALGYLPESVSFYPHMTGFELLKYYARLKHVPLSEVDMRLEQVGLHDAAHRRLHTYSKGMRQRLGLAQSMLGTPKLLFLDEPTTGLDPILRRDFYQIMNELRSHGATIVISSHALNEVEAQADRVAIIKQGKLMACDSLSNLGRQVSLPVRARLKVKPGDAESVAQHLDNRARIERVNNQTVDFVCDEGDKIAVLQSITNLGDVVLDINMEEPRLVDIYLHHMNGAQP